MRLSWLVLVIKPTCVDVTKLYKGCALTVENDLDILALNRSKILDGVPIGCCTFQLIVARTHGASLHLKCQLIGITHFKGKGNIKTLWCCHLKFVGLVQQFNFLFSW